ncbi:sugar ABC transporter ATP-binding protein [Thiolinea disciformis]|uniref:sugar ABC transporter ATP-binding protein n=1 Tax=Thiolinea disciformis TaxID=125614 RepID=UPI00035D536B|nr:sugar ABC transporter ATP-binding protein [Thiolinea disciformis]
MSTQPIIHAVNMGKVFPGVIALDHVSFDLFKGEVHALMGENGAGKSTLMKILAGVYQRDSGELYLDGKPVTFNNTAAAQAQGIGIVHQELHLMPHLSAAQNIWIGRESTTLGGWFVDEDALVQKTQQLFDRLNLKLDPKTPIRDLTVATQQMVEIAKALSYQSQILIMDEPTAALNPREVDELFRVIHQLRAEGVAIVYISHKMDEIQRISDRITVMRDGKTIGTVPAQTPMNQIVAMMVGRELPALQKDIPDQSHQPVLLKVQGLTRGKVVQNVSFELRRGEILGFAGLMGAGRTEVARLIFGADTREVGAIWINGQEQAIRSPQDAVTAGIGYLSEDRKQLGLATGMPVEANITLSSLKRWLKAGFWLDSTHLNQQAQELVTRLRVKTPSIHQTVRLLSGGNQQKVVIAKWLLRDCEVLIFDEPTRGIDVGAKAEIYKLINDLAAQGRGIIVISSELPEVLLLSHRILVMCEGHVTGEVSGRDATQEQIMNLATQRGSLTQPQAT